MEKGKPRGEGMSAAWGFARGIYGILEKKKE